MSNLSIGLTGLRVAQQAIDIISNNIANSATEGYHRQEMSVSSITIGGVGANSVGGGAEVTEIRRSIDKLIERQLLGQTSLLGQVEQELTTLQTIEAVMGDISTEGISSAIDAFFNSLKELAGNPASQAYQEQAIWSADTMATEFRNLSDYLDGLDNYLVTEANDIVAQMNSLTFEIAELNTQISAMNSRTGAANQLMDRRDQAALELAELAGVSISTQGNSTGEINVAALGLSVVTQGMQSDLEVGTDANGDLGVSISGAGIYNASGAGGKLGAILALKNSIIDELKTNLDTLVNTIITGINRLHVQGVGSEGSFSELTGREVGSGNISTWSSDVSAGSLYIRVIDSNTGAITRESISVTPSSETISDIAAKIEALDNISASVVNGCLHIQADTGYKFDFLPALTSEPYDTTLTGTASPAISGTYAGDDNQIYTCTVVGTGEVGLTSGLGIQVRNGAGELVTTLNVGSGYAAGDAIDIGNGIEISLGAGTLNDAETFRIQALADSDPTGLLAAAGINVFFTGSTAGDVAVASRIIGTPGFFAASLGVDMNDNLNVERMAALGDTGQTALSGATPASYYQQLVTALGQKISTREARRDTLENITLQLQNQRDTVSGVDVNEEAAKLLVFERMFQAVSKVISIQTQALEYLMEMV